MSFIQWCQSNERHREILGWIGLLQAEFKMKEIHTPSFLKPQDPLDKFQTPPKIVLSPDLWS